MFEKIQHIGYLVADLDAAVTWFKQTFGGDNAIFPCWASCSATT